MKGEYFDLYSSDYCSPADIDDTSLAIPLHVLLFTIFPLPPAEKCVISNLDTPG
jgi:hypothetical protein